jgi:hypothetical protein
MSERKIIVIDSDSPDSLREICNAVFHVMAARKKKPWYDWNKL